MSFPSNFPQKRFLPDEFPKNFCREFFYQIRGSFRPCLSEIDPARSITMSWKLLVWKIVERSCSLHILLTWYVNNSFYEFSFAYEGIYSSEEYIHLRISRSPQEVSQWLCSFWWTHWFPSPPISLLPWTKRGKF